MSAEISEQVTEEVGFIPAMRCVLGAMEMGLPTPSWMYPWEFAWYVDDCDTEGELRSAFDVKAEMAAIRALLPRPTTGAWNKSYGTVYYSLEARFLGIDFKIRTPRRSVCEKVVTGKKVEMVPDPEYVAPEVPMVEKEIDVVEWRCSD